MVWSYNLLDNTRASPLVELFNIDRFFPITSRYCDFLDIVDIVHLTRTCKVLCRLYEDIKAHKCNIDRRLSLFFQNAQAFRAHSARFSAVAAGEFVHEYFDREKQGSAELHITVEDDQRVHDLLRYLERAEGWTFDVSQPGKKPPYTSSHMDDPQIVSYTLCLSAKSRKLSSLPNSNNDQQLAIWLITTKTPAVQAVLSQAYPSHQLAFRSWNKAYSIFPYLTFQKKLSFLPEKPRDSLDEQDLGAYCSRSGHDIFSEDATLWNRFCQNPGRDVGDSQTWQIHFELEDFKVLGTRDYVLDSSSFTISFWHGAVQNSSHEIKKYNLYRAHTRTLASVALKYRYVCAGTFHSWIDSVIYYKDIEGIGSSAARLTYPSVIGI